MLLIVLVLAVPAEAQPGREPRGGQGGRLPSPENMSSAQLHQLFDAMLVVQAQTALQLNDEQYAAFVERVKALQDVRRRTQRERARMLNELQRLVRRNAPPAPNDEITRRLDALREFDASAAQDLQRAYAAVDDTLSALQQARFRLLEDQIERRKLELISRARSRPGKGRQ
jgi:hypothetical protein